MFTLPVKRVGNTRILVCQTCDGRQLTCYENTVDIENGQENAMVLPFPISADDKDGKQGMEMDKKEVVTFVDLSKCSNILLDLDDVFPTMEAILPPSFGFGSSMGTEYLPTKVVGSYTCSVAKSLADLRRIDPRVFHVSPNLDEVLGKHYSVNFGFIICKINKSGKQHPIAYVHHLMKPPSDQKDPVLFVPTRHEHGGDGGNGRGEKKEDPNLPHWDHDIFSVNTIDARKAGLTPDETKKEIEEKIAAEDELRATYTKMGQEVFVQPHELKPAKTRPYILLGTLPINVAHPGIFRRLHVKGPQPNKDLVFTFKLSNIPINVPKPPPNEQSKEHFKLNKIPVHLVTSSMV